LLLRLALEAIGVNIWASHGEFFQSFPHDLVALCAQGSRDDTPICLSLACCDIVWR
jgi:hypothetical protein